MNLAYINKKNILYVSLLGKKYIHYRIKIVSKKVYIQVQTLKNVQGFTSLGSTSTSIIET